MAYKAVTKNRTSCIVYGTKYCLRYLKGHIVKKHPGTLGIFCFKTKRDARNFTSVLVILKVKGKKSQKPPFQIPNFHSEDINAFYKNLKTPMMDTPPGTILYDEVKVLE